MAHLSHDFDMASVKAKGYETIKNAAWGAYVQNYIRIETEDPVLLYLLENKPFHLGILDNLTSDQVLLMDEKWISENLGSLMISNNPGHTKETILNRTGETTIEGSFYVYGNTPFQFYNRFIEMFPQAKLFYEFTEPTLVCLGYGEAGKANEPKFLYYGNAGELYEMLLSREWHLPYWQETYDNLRKSLKTENST